MEMPNGKQEQTKDKSDQSNRILQKKNLQQKT